MSDETQRRPRRVIRGWRGIEAYSGLRRSQMWELIRRGDWPPPTKLSARSVVWFEDEVAAAQERLLKRKKT
jgi:predicted DNA-binding transcriptional regulator AlpA